MGGYVTRQNYEWVYSDQPHADRRKEMLRLYPQMKQLMRVNPHFKWIVGAEIAAQIVACYLFRDLSWIWIIFFAYALGGTINHSLTLAIHEMSHNNAFGYGEKSKWNMIFAMIANLPILVPYCVSFKKYHLDHHRMLGVDGSDTDIPMEWEGNFFTSPLRKLVWVFIQPLLYCGRPLAINPKPISMSDLANLCCQVVFGVIMYHMWGGRPLIYLLLSTFLGLGLHPMAGHFIAEHYMFLKGHETYSYYGPLNILAYNVGYHMEHHDFPNIPGSRLPLVTKIAPDFYADLPKYNSWIGVIKNFITDQTIGPYSRIKRKPADKMNDEVMNGQKVE